MINICLENNYFPPSILTIQVKRLQPNLCTKLHENFFGNVEASFPSDINIRSRQYTVWVILPSYLFQERKVHNSEDGGQL